MTLQQTDAAPHELTDTAHVVYRHWHADPAVRWWRVWVILPSGDSAFSTGATVQEAYKNAMSNGRRCRPRPFLPARWERRNKRFQGGPEQ